MFFLEFFESFLLLGLSLVTLILVFYALCQALVHLKQHFSQCARLGQSVVVHELRQAIMSFYLCLEHGSIAILVRATVGNFWTFIQKVVFQVFYIVKHLLTCWFKRTDNFVSFVLLEMFIAVGVDDLFFAMRFLTPESCFKK